MKTVENAKQIALRSYSMWLNRLAFALMILPEVIYATIGVDTNPRVWFFAGAVLYIAVEVARYIKQESISGPGLRSSALVMLTALFLAMGKPTIIDWPADAPPDPAPSYTTQEFLAVALPLIAKWEGLRTTAYRDIVGVWTVCYGETKGVRPGDTYTETECRDMLAREVLEYRAGWRAYVSKTALSEYLHVFREVAFVDLAYNVGVAGAGSSTATRRLNSGNIAGACTAIGWWNKAGQRVVRGLVNRRTEFVALCRIGLT